MTMETLTLDIDPRGVARLTLNRPEVHNAFNEQVIAELRSVIERLGADPAVRVIVLAGAGKSFSAGADLNWMKKAAGYTREENEADAVRLADMLQALNTVRKPVIALVQGAAFGGGVGLVACADMAFATPNARFSLSEVRLGLIPATISPFVVAAIGQRSARRVFMSGEVFGAEQAQAFGLVDAVAEDPDALEAMAEAMIGEILKGGPEAVSAAKDLVFAVAGKDIDEALRRETARRIAHHRDSDEGREGIGAFLEKRKPRWWPEKD